MNYILMTTAIILSVVNACLLRAFSKQNNEGYSPFLFNTGVNLVWIIILSAVYIANGAKYSSVSVAFGAVYGILLFAFLFFKTQSMATGPVSLSTLIGSCAFVIATGFGVIYCSESINIFQIIGMILLFISLFLCVSPKKGGEKISAKWLLYCLGFFLSGGFVGILYKLFGKSGASSETDSMILTASVVSTMLFFIFGMFENKGKHIPHITKATLLFMLFSGMASCLYIRLNVSLSNLIPSVIFFPVSNGGMVILSTIAGKLIFKEKLSRIQLTGIAIGCAAVVITGCGEEIFTFFIK